MHKSISDELFNQLKETLNKSWLKTNKRSYVSSSVAITFNKKYFSGLFESMTHLLDVTSEHAALVLAISNKDAHVKEIITLLEDSSGFVLNPLVVKILVDHYRRTGTKISYSVFNLEKKCLFSSDDLTSYYNPKIELLEKINDWEVRDNFIIVDNSRDINEQLKECAFLGTETHFSSGTKSLYGASVLAGNKIYFCGVHSSYDRRLNLHSEMSAFLCALADGNKDITKLALVSTKFQNEIPHVCGCCRQFLSEIQLKNGKEIEILSFSFDGTKEFKIKLKDYLTHVWDSGS